MSAAVTNMAVMFGAMQVSKRIPFEDHPEYVHYARMAYQIKKKNDLTVLKFVKAKSPMSQEPGELITTTHKDYDMAEVSKSMRGILMGCGLLAFMHLYMGYTNPLVIQSILPVKNALESNMAKIWVWGVPATGELKRPFKPAPGLFGGAGGPQTDKASVQEAEKVTAVVQPKTDGEGIEGCGRVTDPYLEHGPLVVFIDLLLAKPRVYRHLLYNRSTASGREREAFVILRMTRHFMAVVLVESYLRWFAICVHPHVVAQGQGIVLPPSFSHTWDWTLGRFSLPPFLGSAARTFCATFVEMLTLHGAVTVASTLIHRMYARRSGQYRRVWHWSLASTALVYASISTALLLSLLLVWDSRLPVDRRVQQTQGIDLTQWTGSSQKFSTHSALLSAMSNAMLEWNTEWLIRNMIGGMSAGIALAVVLPMHAGAGLAVLLLGLLAQLATRRWRHTNYHARLVARKI
ncbi:hypothetical protein MVES_001745 [Malassezia vespertilionis]|uniref:Protein ARV n=1 Tax=Malassezia vespertilionis TaxID=2020962 RepID=A0A2N1JDE1_9BASI|nr:hypothetical protein MVES_001745 [Malassezia vespertilionis]